MRYFAAILLFIFTSCTVNEQPECPESQECDLMDIPVFSIYDLELNSANFKFVCDMHGISHSDIVWAQALLESGRFTSSVYKSRNNFLGLWDSLKHEYYTFDHWSDCLKAYKTKIQYKYKGGDYYDFLDSIGYAEATNYIPTVQKIVRQNEANTDNRYPLWYSPELYKVVQ